MSNLLTRCIAAACMAVAACSAVVAQAQPVAFPTRPVRLILANSPGSPPDVIARAIAEGLSREWGQQVLVENRPGGSGIIAVNELRRGRADGHDILLGDVGTLAINGISFRKLPYDPQKDLVPVVDVLSVPWVLFTSRQSRFKTIGELLAAAKAAPGKYSYSSAGKGSPSFMVGEMLKLRAGVNLLEVPFKETAQMQPAVINNEVDIYITSMGGARGIADRIMPLGMAARQRDPLHPDVPTVEEAGGPAGFEVIAWAALTVVRDVPEPVIRKIREDAYRVMQRPELRQRAAAMGMSLSQGRNTEELRTFIRAETEKYGQVVKASNAYAD